MEDERCHRRANRVGTDGSSCADSGACLPDAYSVAGRSVRCYLGLRQSRIHPSHAETVEPGWAVGVDGMNDMDGMDRVYLAHRTNGVSHARRFPPNHQSLIRAPSPQECRDITSVHGGNISRRLQG